MIRASNELQRSRGVTVNVMEALCDACVWKIVYPHICRRAALLERRTPPSCYLRGEVKEGKKITGRL
jgi:hypothetical protein